MTEIFRHRVSHCPSCRQTLNATGDPQGRGPPRTGDLSICSGCGTILRFDRHLRLVAMTPHQIEQLPSKTAAELLDMQQVWRERNKTRVQVPS